MPFSVRGGAYLQEKGAFQRGEAELLFGLILGGCWLHRGAFGQYSFGGEVTGYRVRERQGEVLLFRGHGAFCER